MRQASQVNVAVFFGVMAGDMSCGKKQRSKGGRKGRRQAKQGEKKMRIDMDEGRKEGGEGGRKEEREEGREGGWACAYLGACRSKAC